MNVGDLYYVARRLKALAEQALGAAPGQIDRVPLYQQLVLGDVLASPGSTIVEITERQSMAQSMVSKAVATLRDQGLLDTETDPADRRRVRVMPSRRLAQWAQGHLHPDAEEALAPLIAGLSARDRSCVLRAVALLHRSFKRQEEQGGDR